MRDPDGVRVAQIVDASKPELQLRHQAMSTWSLSVPAAGASGALLAQRGYGIEVERDGELMLSGPVVKRHRRWALDVDELDLAGPDDLAWLARRLAHPTPTLSTPPYSTQAHDVRTGPAETVIKEYVDANAGPGAVTARRVQGLTVATTLSTGSTITGRARWKPLLDFVRELAATDGFGLTANGLVFDVVAPRTSAVVFSRENGNLGSYDYSDDAPEATFVIVAGQGEGTARQIVEVSDASALADWGRIESFRDRRDTAVEAELTQAGVETLADAASATAIAFDVVDGVAGTFADDYRVGDWVTVELEDATLVDQVREAHVKVSADGDEIALVVGPPTATILVPALFRRLALLGRDVANLNAI